MRKVDGVDIIGMKCPLCGEFVHIEENIEQGSGRHVVFVCGKCGLKALMICREIGGVETPAVGKAGFVAIEEEKKEKPIEKPVDKKHASVPLKFKKKGE